MEKYIAKRGDEVMVTGYIQATMDGIKRRLIIRARVIDIVEGGGVRVLFDDGTTMAVPHGSYTKARPIRH